MLKSSVFGKGIETAGIEIQLVGMVIVCVLLQALRPVSLKALYWGILQHGGLSTSFV
jgi:hypothetical protein